jgi:hypothetical protein
MASPFTNSIKIRCLMLCLTVSTLRSEYWCTEE